jgi:hypothetical protein
MWREVWSIVFTIELPPYAKNDKIWLKKLAGWEVISSSMVVVVVVLLIVAVVV